MRNVGQALDIREVGDPVAAASDTDQNSDRIDMAGYEGVIFLVPITDSVATGVATLTVEQNDSDSDTGMDDLENSVATATCAVNDDLNGKILRVEVYRPQKRYVQAVVTSGTANIAFGNTVAILYGGKNLPVTDHSTIADSAFAVSPEEAA